MRIARIPQMFIYVSAVLTLASSAMPARAATNYTACFAPATIKINLHESSCMSGSGWVKLLSYSMQNPPASSGKNGQAKAPSTVSMLIGANGGGASSVQSLTPGTHLKSVALIAFKDANSRPEAVLVFSEVIITSKQFSGNSTVPTISLSMDVNSVTVSYNNSAGSAGPPK